MSRSPATPAALPAEASLPPTLTPAHLLAYVLDKDHLPAHVLLRGVGLADSRAIAGDVPRLTVALRQYVAVADLLPIVRRFQDSAHACCLILGRTQAAEDYAEQLLVNEAAATVFIERRFRRHSDRLGPDRLIGFVCREPPALEYASGKSILRLLHECLAAAGTLDTARVECAADPVAPETDILAFLGEEGRRRLAVRLRWKAVAPDCYASPNTRLSEQALLRGPLFIDEGVEIGPEDIHIGPAWLRPGTPPVSVASRDPRADGRASLSVRQYFIGPPARPQPVYEICKRIFDVAFGLLCGLIVLPVMVLAALAVWLTDFGPVFFSHEREGLHGKPFGCVKFRTMIRNAEALKDQLRAHNQVDGPQFKIAHDPRITRVGRFLRRTNIDELPQLWNVLRGDMSIVGPRPSPFKENQLCPPWREARLSVKPGITGLWQVSRSPERGAADFQEWIFYDTQYVERRSFWLDLKIILLTVKELMGKGQ